MVERQARDLKVRGSNPGPGSNVCLEYACTTWKRKISSMDDKKMGIKKENFPKK